MDIRAFIIQKVKDEGSHTAVSRKTGVSQGTITKIYHGDTRPEDGTIIKIAKAYGIPIGEFIQGITIPISGSDKAVSIFSEGTPALKSIRMIPIISKAQAGEGGFWEDCYPVGHGLESIECPAQIIDPNAFAFLVEGDSMDPRYKHGERVIIDTTKEVANNDDVIVKLADGQVMAKRYRRINGTILLESYNQTVHPIIVNASDIVCCFKIVCRI